MSTISNITPDPTVGPIGVLVAVSFTLSATSAGPPLVSVRFSDDVEEVAWDGGQFRGYFANPRSSAPVGGGPGSYTIYRAGGWRDSFTVVVYDRPTES